MFAGRYAQAEAAATEYLLGRPTSFGTNLPLPHVLLDIAGAGDVTGYRRQLDLDSGIVSVEYDSDGVHFSREVLASNPHDLIALRLIASRQGAIGCTLRIADAIIPGESVAEATAVVFRGRATETRHSDGNAGVAVRVHAELAVDGGIVRPVGQTVRVTGADAVTLFVAVGTDWAGEDPAERVDRLIRAALHVGYAAVRNAHVEDHGGLMRRVSIDLGPAPAPELSTAQRRRRLADGERDDHLVALYFQYGRYLTIAGSRANSPLPLALQGIWNDGLASSASWTDDFHLDMNTQQNYWAAEPANLAECHEPLMRFVERLAEAGRATARELYGAPGWVAHTVTNAWGYTAPGWGIGWGLHITGGAWLALHLWDHYEYGPDERFLRDTAYPVIRGAAEFWLAHLVAEPDHGWLVAGPSESPENWYIAPDGSRCSVAMGNTVDWVFVEAILRICATAAERLGVDADFRARIADARRRLPPLRVGRHGQLMEWLHDFEEADPAHRHTSHLCALFPERQITPRGTPELARAARVTIERRLSAPGWEQTEWAEANLVLFHARLLDGDQALAHLTRLIGDASEANLMSYSAGGVAGAAQNIYSFDGNAGGTAGVAEMLVQSDGVEIELLPALPVSWRDGSVRGLRVRGGATVDLRWSAGRLDRAVIRARPATSFRIRHGESIVDAKCADDGVIVIG